MLVLRAAAKTNPIWMLVAAFWGRFIMTSSKTVRIYELLPVLAEKDYGKSLVSL